MRSDADKLGRNSDSNRRILIFAHSADESAPAVRTISENRFRCGPNCLFRQLEVDGYVGLNFDGLAIQHVGLVFPLPDGIAGGPG